MPPDQVILKLVAEWLRKADADMELAEYLLSQDVAFPNAIAFHSQQAAEKYLKSFTIYVDDRDVYAKEIADALEADLQPLATSGLIARISKYDTNPANNPQPSEHSSQRS